MTMIDEIRADMRKASRAAGFRDDDVVDDELIARRRRQVGAVAIIVFFGVVLATLRADVGEPIEFVNADMVKAAMITLAGAFLFYVIEKERNFRRIGDLGRQEREIHLASAERLLEGVEHLAEAGPLRIEDVLDGLLAGAVEFTGADAGSLSLVGTDGQPEVWSSDGNDEGRGPLANRVARSGRALLVSPSGVPAIAGGARMAVPLSVNGVLIGVIEVVPEARRSFDAVDLELLERFSDRSSRALTAAFDAADAAEILLS